jgi:hypothetical protein
MSSRAVRVTRFKYFISLPSDMRVRFGVAKIPSDSKGFQVLRTPKTRAAGWQAVSPRAERPVGGEKSGEKLVKKQCAVLA